MNLIILLKNSFKILRANRNRTFLTVLGIVIGIAAVIVIMSVGAGAQSLILDQISSLGTDLVSIMPGYTDESGPPATVYGIQVTTLKEKDTEALSEIPEVEYIGSYVEGITNVQYQNQNFDVKVIGVTSAYPDIESINFEQGGFFTTGDEDGISRVAVIGSQLAQDFFGQDDPIGKKIKVKKEIFKVIGVIEKRGSVGFENQDNIVVIPLGAAQKIIFGINHLHHIAMKVNSENSVPYVSEQAKDIMREQHDIDNPDKDDFTVYTTANFIKTLSNITNALKFFLSAIAAISLLVGGVGIMNIMLVAVNERTREIGLRKAIGATEKNIQNQFLIESIIVTLLGGVIGIILGAIISGGIAAIAAYLGYKCGFVITIPSILMGVIVSGLVGIIFGWYPSRKASRLEPVDALRYE
ncbi:ABC transporter permease [Patescibacteria group bacterium]|nr:ABC transporter permease [Patescibacteria group bacterium]